MRALIAKGLLLQLNAVYYLKNINYTNVTNTTKILSGIMVSPIMLSVIMTRVGFLFVKLLFLIPSETINRQHTILLSRCASKCYGS